MGVIFDDGFAAPFDADGQSYPPAGDRIPVLRSFYLGYDIGSTPSDHQILSIETMVGGHSEVIDTILNFQPANIPDGRLFPALQDQDPGGEQFYYKMSHSTLARAGVRRYQIQQVGNVGEVVRKLPSHIFQQGPISPALPGPFAALVGFRLFFQGRDNQVDRVRHMVRRRRPSRCLQHPAWIRRHVLLPCRLRRHTSLDRDERLAWHRERLS